jgi:hypothetical protein
MKENKSKKKCLFQEDGILQSLYYLYQELLKAHMQELAFIMEATIQDCEEAIRKNFIISPEAEEIFKLFHFVRSARQLNKGQMHLFLSEIEEYEAKN